jgi:hypothetical protein
MKQSLQFYFDKGVAVKLAKSSDDRCGIDTLRFEALNKIAHEDQKDKPTCFAEFVRGMKSLEVENVIPA